MKTQHRLSYLLLVGLISFSTSACSEWLEIFGLENDPARPLTVPPLPTHDPATLSYASKELIFVQATPGGPHVPVFEPEKDNSVPRTYAALSFIIAPALPAGIGIDPTTGAIEGASAATWTRTTYTVQAYDGANTIPGARVEVILQVVSDQAPSLLSYDYDSAVFVAREAIPPDRATVTGDVTAWSVAPPLPFDLSISQLDGTISGTPDLSFAEEDFVVTASNPLGSTTATLRFSAVSDEWRSLWTGGGDSIVVRERDFDRERLVPRTVRAARQVLSMVATSDGRHVYAAESGADRIMHYVVDPTRRLPDQGSEAAQITLVSGLAISASGDRLLAAGMGTLVSYSIDPLSGALTGAVTITGPWSVDVRIIAHPSDELVYVLAGGGVNVVRTAPQVALVEELQLGGFVLDLELEFTGRFAYAQLAMDDRIRQYRLSTLGEIDAGDPALVPLPTVFFDVGATVLDTASLGGRYFALTSDPLAPTSNIIEFAIDRATGELAATATTPVAVEDGATRLYAPPGGDSLVVVGIFLTYLAGETQLVQRDLHAVRSFPTAVLSLPGRRFGTTTWVLSVHRDTGKMRATKPIASGSLLPSTQGLVTTAALPNDAVLDETQSRVYVACQSGVIQVFDLDNATGALNLASSVPAGTFPSKIVLDRSGRFAYVIDNALGLEQVLRFDVEADGSLTFAEASGGIGAGAIARIDPLGRYFYSFTPFGVVIDNINLEDGSFFNRVLQPGLPAFGDVVFAPSGRFIYASDPALGNVGRYVPDFQGRLGSPLFTPTGSGPRSLALDFYGERLFAANEASFDLSAYDVDPDTGALTERNKSTYVMGGTPTSLDPGGLGFIGLSGARMGILWVGTRFGIEGNERAFLPTPSVPTLAH